MKMGCLADWHERQSSKGWNITMNCIIWDTRDSVPEEYDSQIWIEDHENLRSCLDHGLFNPVWHELRWQTTQENGRRRSTKEYLCTNKHSSHCDANTNKHYCSNDNNKPKTICLDSRTTVYPYPSRYSVSLNRFSWADHDSLIWALFQNEEPQERSLWSPHSRNTRLNTGRFPLAGT